MIRPTSKISIAEFDAETRLRALAAKGSAKAGLILLDKLDAGRLALQIRGVCSQ